MNSAIRYVLRQTLTLEPFKGLGGVTGVPAYEDPVTVRARISKKNRMIRDSGGREIVSSTFAILDTRDVTDVNVRSRVTLKDGTQPSIISVEQSVDDRGKLALLRLNFK